MTASAVAGAPLSLRDVQAILENAAVRCVETSVVVQIRMNNVIRMKTVIAWETFAIGAISQRVCQEHPADDTTSHNDITQSDGSGICWAWGMNSCYHEGAREAECGAVVVGSVAATC